MRERERGSDRETNRQTDRAVSSSPCVLYELIISDDRKTNFQAVRRQKKHEIRVILSWDLFICCFSVFYISK